METLALSAPRQILHGRCKEGRGGLGLEIGQHCKAPSSSERREMVVDQTHPHGAGGQVCLSSVSGKAGSVGERGECGEEKTQLEKAVKKNSLKLIIGAAYSMMLPSPQHLSSILDPCYCVLAQLHSDICFYTFIYLRFMFFLLTCL